MKYAIVAITALAVPLAAVVILAYGAPAAQAQSGVDYDADYDGLIEISNLAQLDVMRYDLDGLGSPSVDDRTAYHAAFPRAVAGMGCPNGECTGYELADAGDAYWNNGAGWLPIAIDYYDELFEDAFDGGAHTISNLFINRRNVGGTGYGLFASVDGDICNIGLVAVNVIGSDYVGRLVGESSAVVANADVDDTKRHEC